MHKNGVARTRCNVTRSSSILAVVYPIVHIVYLTSTLCIVHSTDKIAIATHKNKPAFCRLTFSLSEHLSRREVGTGQAGNRGRETDRHEADHRGLRRQVGGGFAGSARGHGRRDGEREAVAQCTERTEEPRRPGCFHAVRGWLDRDQRSDRSGLSADGIPTLHIVHVVRNTLKCVADKDRKAFAILADCLRIMKSELLLLKIWFVFLICMLCLGTYENTFLGCHFSETPELFQSPMTRNPLQTTQDAVSTAPTARKFQSPMTRTPFKHHDQCVPLWPGWVSIPYDEEGFPDTRSFSTRTGEIPRVFQSPMTRRAPQTTRCCTAMYSRIWVSIPYDEEGSPDM